MIRRMEMNFNQYKKISELEPNWKVTLWENDCNNPYTAWRSGEEFEKKIPEPDVRKLEKEIDALRRENKSHIMEIQKLIGKIDYLRTVIKNMKLLAEKAKKALVRAKNAAKKLKTQIEKLIKSNEILQKFTRFDVLDLE